MKLIKKYKTILIVIGTFLFSLILFLSIKSDWNVSFIIRDIFYFPLSFVNNDDICNCNYNELEKELESMKQLLDIDDTLSSYDRISAVAISRNVSYWNQELVINKGNNQGIKENMAVVVGNNLIGKTTKVGINTAAVRLITNNMSNNNISVKIWNNDTSINGILYTDSNNNLLISGIDNTISIEKNTLITTSGLSDIFPGGIIIGKVSNVTLDQYGISQKLHIIPSYDLDNIRFVSVLKRKIS